MMEICKTDLKKIIDLLSKGAAIIEKYCSKPCELDKARQNRQLIKKLNKKLKS